MTTVYQTLQELMEVCIIHDKRLKHALGHIAAFLPMTPSTLSKMSDDDYVFLDSAVGRFEKLQDTIGMKIFPRILKLGEEFEKSETFLDRLNKLEALTVIDSAADWIELRRLRNELSHEYAQMDPEELSKSINKFVASCQLLEAIWQDVQAYVSEKKLVQ